MDISSTAKPTRLRRWTGMCADDCEVCCNGGVMGGGMDWERRINAGRMNGLRAVGCCPWQWRTSGRGQSYAYEPTDWRAGCGKSARPVRREGQGQSLVP